MRVFVYEHLCSAPDAGAGPASLRAEGRAMLLAVLRDLERCPDVCPVTLLAPSLSSLVAKACPGVATHVAAAGDEEGAFRALARAADFTLVIAPECDDILFQRCRWVEEEGGRLLGPTSEAVRRTGDKLALARHLAGRGVGTPRTAAFPEGGPAPLPFPLVCKPRHGAGSQATFLVRNEDELASLEGWHGERIVQRYVPGQAGSVAFLAGPGGWVALPPAAQALSTDGRFRYRGGRLPLPPALAGRARRLAERAARAVPGLHGYFGVDVVLGEAEDGPGDAVIEINPRLTTSYVGLRALANFNLAEALLAAATGRPLPAGGWRADTIRFEADGRVRREAPAPATGGNP
jgi:predicted ATP-grasp superfamily ATP-dependent carboligase